MRDRSLADHIALIALRCTESRLELGSIFDSEIKHLCELLKNNSYVTELSLYDSSLSDDGALKLVEFLPSTVTKLIVSRNSIFDDGAIALISRNPSFEYLDLSDMREAISEKTARFILANPEIKTIIDVTRTDIEWKHPELFESINKLNEEKKAAQEISFGMRR